MRLANREWALLAAIGILFALPILGVPGFYTLSNIKNLAIDNVPVLVSAVGMTVIIIAAQIDISIGSQFVLCGVVAGVAAKAGVPMLGVVVLTLAVGALLGAINGLLVAYARMPSVIVTLATMAIIRNAIIRATGGDWIQNLPQDFQWFGLNLQSAQSIYLITALFLFIAFWWAMRFTGFGRSFYAVGCDHEASRRIGLSPLIIVFVAFVLMGLFSGAAAIFNFTRYPTIETNAGVGLELKVIASVVVGGTAITGGRGSLLGTLLGVILLGAIGTVFTFLHVNPAWERAIQGAIILIAVVADTAFQKKAVHV